MTARHDQELLVDLTLATGPGWSWTGRRLHRTRPALMGVLVDSCQWRLDPWGRVVCDLDLDGQRYTGTGSIRSALAAATVQVPR